jgi:hypothetical protein
LEDIEPGAWPNLDCSGNNCCSTKNSKKCVKSAKKARRLVS